MDFVDRGVANAVLTSSRQVYKPVVVDVVGGRVQIRDEMYHVVRTKEYLAQVPEAFRALCDSGLRPVDTGDDTACGVHFVFGEPSDDSAGQLVAREPRQLAADLLGDSFSALVDSGVPSMCIESVQNLLWTEYVVKHLSRTTKKVSVFGMRWKLKIPTLSRRRVA